MTEHKKFFSYVIPSVLAFALSGVYSIVDGFFIGNSVGDIGLSAINMAYPVVSLIQAIGAGVGMGGSVCYSIRKAEGRETEAREHVAGALWLLLLTSIVTTVALYLLTTPLLKALGSEGILLSMGEDYLRVITLGAGLQIIGTGLVPLVRNHGGSTFAMVAMILGFATNIGLDYLFIWVYGWGAWGAALATVLGQGVAMVGGIIYLWCKRGLTFRLSPARLPGVLREITAVGIGPFGLTLTPCLSLVFINRFAVYYGGAEAVAVYACGSYVLYIVYMVLQGVGDGSQPLMSQYFGARTFDKLRRIRIFAYRFAMALAAVSIVILFIARWQVGVLLGASDAVTAQVGHVFPIFLLALPFISITRVTIASFYATGRNMFSYILTYVEPLAMLFFLLILPPLFGGQQIIVWWGTAAARIFSAVLALILKRRVDQKELLLSNAALSA